MKAYLVGRRTLRLRLHIRWRLHGSVSDVGMFLSLSFEQPSLLAHPTDKIRLHRRALLGHPRQAVFLQPRVRVLC